MPLNLDPRVSLDDELVRKMLMDADMKRRRAKARADQIRADPAFLSDNGDAWFYLAAIGTLISLLHSEDPTEPAEPIDYLDLPHVVHLPFGSLPIAPTWSAITGNEMVDAPEGYTGWMIDVTMVPLHAPETGVHEHINQILRKSHAWIGEQIILSKGLRMAYAREDRRADIAGMIESLNKSRTMTQEEADAERERQVAASWPFASQ